jgi:hypothetical protein
MAYKSIDYFDSIWLMIYDRNFANYKMVDLHLWPEKQIKLGIPPRATQRVVKEF